MKRKLFDIDNMAVTAMLASAAIVLYLTIELPLNPLVPFLKVNFADIPAVLAGLIISPIAGIAVTGIRCFVHLFRTSTFGIGETADFIVGSAIVIIFCISWRKLGSKKKYTTVHINIITFAVTLAGAIVAGFFANLMLYPVYMSLIGRPIENASALFIYLAATAITNAERVVMNIGVCMFLLPFVPRFARIAGK